MQAILTELADNWHLYNRGGALIEGDFDTEEEALAYAEEHHIELV
jgi:hypothetical protein